LHLLRISNITTAQRAKAAEAAVVSNFRAQGLINEPSNSPPRGHAPIRDEFEFDGLPLIETAEASTLYRRDVNEHVLAAALRLDESITLGRIERGAVTTCMWSWPGLWDASENVLVPRFRNVILFQLADQKVVELLSFAHCGREPPWHLSSSGPLFAVWSFVFRRNLISLSRCASMFVISGRGWTD
jgi:hypothetical protein